MNKASTVNVSLSHQRSCRAITMWRATQRPGDVEFIF